MKARSSRSEAHLVLTFHAEPHRSVRITRKLTSASPRPLLSEAFAAQSKKTTGLTLGAIRPKGAVAQLPMNAVYLESVLGHDEGSLRDLLAGRLAGMSFDLRWVTEEDVVVTPLLPVTAAAAASDADAKLRSMRTSIRSLQASSPFCAAVELARVDDLGRLERRETWTPVGPSDRNMNRWNHKDGSLSVSNAFSALSVDGQKPKAPAPPANAWAQGGVVGGGFNRRKSTPCF